MNNHYLYFGFIFIIILLVCVILLLRRKRTTGKASSGKKDLELKLGKTRTNLKEKISGLLRLHNRVDAELIGELEEILLGADVGIVTATEIITVLETRVNRDKINDPQQIKEVLKNIILELMHRDYDQKVVRSEQTGKPLVIIFTGVNGVGKTTTIGKLAHRYVSAGKSVLLIAADTFRAAAAEQLGIWADRAGALLHRQQSGADPSSVVYDGLSLALKKGIDVVLIDTAGRQHTSVNLMKELGKIARTITKLIPDAPHDVLQVLDATTGQNAIAQVKIFDNEINLTGLILTKLDGTAKGGIVIGIKHQIGLPVKYIGVGEKLEDLQDFQVDEFVSAILN